MPVVQVTLIEGYDDEVKTRLCEAMTKAVLETIDADPEGVTIILNECRPADYMRGGRRRRPGEAKT